MHELRIADCGLRIFTFVLLLQATALSADLPEAVSGLQRRYAAVETVTGAFQQSYRAPGVNQQESGEFWLKKPGLMRWEYRSPEEQLFIADGKQTFLYVPRDRQVTVQPFSVADLHNTPLDLLLGSEDINKNYVVSWENQVKPITEGSLLIRLVPRRKDAEYSFLVLEVDPRNFDLRRVAIRESGGSTSEFSFANVTTNTKIDNKLFRFKTPKGVEEIRIDYEK